MKDKIARLIWWFHRYTNESFPLRLPVHGTKGAGIGLQYKGSLLSGYKDSKLENWFIKGIDEIAKFGIKMHITYSGDKLVAYTYARAGGYQYDFNYKVDLDTSYTLLNNFLQKEPDFAKWYKGHCWSKAFEPYKGIIADISDI